MTTIKRRILRRMHQKKAIIKVDCVSEVQIIPFQMRQLMHNLIANSLKFSKPNVPPKLSITCIVIKNGKKINKNFLDNKDYLNIIVEDNGIGFDDEYSKKIVEVFQRLHGKDEFEGTGIGLSIVKKDCGEPSWIYYRQR